jgi:hypothetical protein
MSDNPQKQNLKKCGKQNMCDNPHSKHFRTHPFGHELVKGGNKKGKPASFEREGVLRRGTNCCATRRGPTAFVSNTFIMSALVTATRDPSGP